ncbi:MAG TPA: hypothetical protein VHS96_16270, partial [Bacteroidia bacterium]|nr:hypothetical protein [Bacteroidia bacterium]
MHNAYGASLKNMTPKDKQSCLKVGNPQLAMIDQVKEVCDAHPNVMPAWHSVQDFEMRIDTMKNLSSMRKVVSSLLEAIDGTLTGAKSDCMQIT